MDNTNLARQYNFEDTYKGLENFENPFLIQPFILSNGADIVKQIDYFKKELSEATDETRKNQLKGLITRHENIMMRRLEITEDLYNNKPEDYSKSEEEDYKDRTIKEPAKVKKDGKVIQHPASKGKKEEKGQEENSKSETLNEKLGRKLGIGKKAKEEKKAKLEAENKEIEDTINKFQQEKLDKSHFEYLFPTKKKQLNRYNEYAKRLEKLILEDKDISKARNMLKLAFVSGNPATRFIDEPDITRIIDWIKSGLFTWKTILDVISDKGLSISDLVREAEHQATIVGLGEQEIKDLVKPYLTNNKIKEKDLCKMANENFDDLFQRNFAFIFNKDKIETNKSKEVSDRNTKKLEAFKLYKEDKYKDNESAAKAVRGMTSVFNKSLKDIGIDNSLKSSLAEIISYLKDKDPKLLEMYNEYQQSKSKEKKDEGNKDKVDVKAAEPKGESTPNIDISEFVKQSSVYKSLNMVKEHMITLMNKRPGDIAKLTSEEDLQALIYKIAKERLLTIGIEGETDDYTIQDVSEWLGREVFPYGTEFYKILSTNNDEEFKEAYKLYIKEFPENKEKDRLKKLKEVFDTAVPKSKYSAKMAKQFRKNNNKYILGEIKRLTDEIYSETKSKQDNKKKK